MTVLNLLLYMLLLHGSENADVQNREKIQDLLNQNGQDMSKRLKNIPKISIINGNLSKILPISVIKHENIPIVSTKQIPSQFRKINVKPIHFRAKPKSKIAKKKPVVCKKMLNVGATKSHLNIQGNRENCTDIRPEKVINNPVNEEILSYKDKTVHNHDNQDKGDDFFEGDDEDEHIFNLRKGNGKKDEKKAIVEDIVTKDTTHKSSEFRNEDESSRSGLIPGKTNIHLGIKTNRKCGKEKKEEEIKRDIDKTSEVPADLKIQKNKKRMNDIVKIIQSIHLKDDLEEKILENRLKNIKVLMDLKKECDKIKSNGNPIEKEVSYPIKDYTWKNNLTSNGEDDKDYVESDFTYKNRPVWVSNPQENELAVLGSNFEETPVTEEVNIYKDHQNSSHSDATNKSIDAKKESLKNLDKIQMKLPNNLEVFQNLELWLKLLQMCAKCQQMRPWYYKAQYPQTYGYSIYPRCYYQQVPQDTVYYYQQLYYESYKHWYYQNQPWLNQYWNNNYLMKNNGVRCN